MTVLNELKDLMNNIKLDDTQAKYLNDIKEELETFEIVKEWLRKSSTSMSLDKIIIDSDDISYDDFNRVSLSLHDYNLKDIGN